MTDYYRDRVRQGGILSNQFVKFVRLFAPFLTLLLWNYADEFYLASQWWNNQVVTMQYGNGEKSVRRWGESRKTPISRFLSLTTRVCRS